MTTKLKTFILAFTLSCGGALFAQEHIAESKSLIGMWRQVVVRPAADGQVITLKTGNYKVMNPDGTLYAFVTWGAGNPNPAADVTTINMYGTYTITSDSTFTEHIIKLNGNPKMNNSDSKLRYKFVPETGNNAVYLMWKNDAGNTWIPEVWERVVFPENKNASQHNEMKL